MFLFIVKKDIPELCVLKWSPGFWESRNSGRVEMFLVLCLNLKLFNIYPFSLSRSSAAP